MRKICSKLFVFVLAIVLVLALGSVLTSCKKNDVTVTPPAGGQTDEGDSAPIESNPVETYVEPDPAP